MFYAKCDLYEGEPARLYRSPEEIRRDIFEIKEKIKRVDSGFNVRSLLMDIAGSSEGKSIEAWIPVLVGITNAAEESLKELRGLRDGLDALFTELEDVKWALGF